MSKNERLCPDCIAKITSQIIQLDNGVTKLLQDVKAIKQLTSKLRDEIS
jgi:hypothetical protein